MRLVDADALLERWCSEVCKAKPRCDEDCMFYDYLTLDSLSPTIETEPHWIPCSERLPEPRIDVWCNSDMGQMVGYYEENVETWYGRDYLELMVTAWMPLPKPWKGDK